MTISISKQQLLLEYMVSSSDVYLRCKSIIAPEYFDPEYKKAVTYIHNYYDQYSAIPSVEQIVVDTSVQLFERTVTSDKIAYCCDEIEQHCRERALFKAIMDSVDKLEKKDYGAIESLIREALAISLDADIGLSYFDDPLSRLEELAETIPKISTGWPTVDETIGGGIARTEMILFSANSGGGKSVALANLGLNFIRQGLNVLYISLELQEQLIGQRYDMMISGVPTAPRIVWESRMSDIQKSITELKNAVDANGNKTGSLQIKRMPVGTNSNQIRAYLKEYETEKGHKPDLILLDYVDLMNPNEKVSMNDVFTKDKLSIEQLRDIGMDYNCVIGTASQQNRGAIEKGVGEVSQAEIAGGISKVNTTDVYISIAMTRQMRDQGIMTFQFLKTRSSDGVGTLLNMAYDRARLLISSTDPIETAELQLLINGEQQTMKGQGQSKSQPSNRPANRPKSSLEALLNSTK